MNGQQRYWISPHYRTDHIQLATATFGQKVTLFEDRMRGYYTIPARLLYKIYDNAILMVLLAVLGSVEVLAVFRRGESSFRRSRELFKFGFNLVFELAPFSDDVDSEVFDEMASLLLDDVYDQTRNGLFHAGVTRSRVEISKKIDQTVAIHFDPSKTEADLIVLNPIQMLNVLELYLSGYCADLRNDENEELRSNFERAWEILREEAA